MQLIFTPIIGSLKDELACHPSLCQWTAGSPDWHDVISSRRLTSLGATRNFLPQVKARRSPELRQLQTALEPQLRR